MSICENCINSKKMKYQRLLNGQNYTKTFCIVFKNDLDDLMMKECSMFEEKMTMNLSEKEN